MIVEPATGASAIVLDPNGDGYVSTTTAGFLGNDQINNELPWQTLIPFGFEPPSDVQNGPNCGFSDFVESAVGSVDPVFHLSTSAHWLFRFRMASIKPNAKSYSILVDIDNTLGSASAAYAAGVNPGFELEIVLATKFGVQVYDHRLPCGSNLVYSYAPNRIQKSIAATSICSSLNYFLEFYVDWADITSQFGVTAATPMRYAIVSNMAAKKSTICNPNSASDIGGVDDSTCGNLEACFTQVILQEPACAPNSSNPCVFSDCPTITGLPLAIGASSVSGTSTEANGTTIRVYVDDILAGTTTVNAGTWTVTLSSPLAANNQVTATAQATGEVESGTNCNNITIAGAFCTDPLTTVGECGNNRKSITGMGPVGAVVRVYLADGTLLNPTGGNLWNTTLSQVQVANDGTFIWRCTGVGQSDACNPSGGPCLADGNYYATAQLPGQCESSPVWFCVNTNTSTNIPSITSVIDATTTTVSGTLANNVAANIDVSIYLYKNNVQIASSTTTNNNGDWSITVASGTFNPCDEVYVVAAKNVAVVSCPTQSATVTVAGGISATPIITGNYCGTTTMVSGTSSESNGTTIQVFSNSILVGTTTVIGGEWTATGLNIPAGASITARATNTGGCKSLSAISAAVVVGAQNTNSITINASAAPYAPDIVESDVTISGTGTPGDLITLYLDNWTLYRDFDEDFPATAVVNGSGTWSVSLIDEVIYAGGVLTATSSNGSSCPSAYSSPMNIVCLPPDQTLTVSPDNTAVCSDSIVANIEVQNAQAGMIYQLFNNTLGSNTGSSILGNNATITLSTFPLTADAEISVTAIKAPFDGSCTSSLNETVDVTVNNNPNLSLTVQAQNSFICCHTATNIQVLSSEVGFEYQLRNNADNALIGSVVAGTGGTINLPTGNIAATTTFNVLATSLLPPTFCSGQLASTVTVTVDQITLAAAGPTQTGPATCGLTTVTLAANAASGSETGAWSIVSGTGGSFSNASSPTTDFSGVADELYILKWTITNGSCSTESDVAINLYSVPTAPTLTLVSQATCASSNGQISVTSPLGPQFEYAINGGAYQFSPLFDNIGAGSYNVTVRHAISLCTSSPTSINLQFFCLYPDATVATISTTISGDVSTNDQVDAGTTYGTTPMASPSNPVGATLTMNPSGNGEYTFLATAPGVYVYDIEVCAPAQSSPCPTETLSITVLDPILNNNPPVVFPDFAVTEEGQAVVFNTLANDASGNANSNLDPATVTVLTTIPSAVGTVSVNTTTGAITFTPAAGFVGTYSYEYEICDDNTPTPNCGTSTQIVSVLPTGSATAVIASDNFNGTIQGQTISVSNTAQGVLSNVSSTGLGTITASIDPLDATQTGVGALTLNANGTYTFVPDASFIGTAVFPYEVCEGSVCVQATLSILVDAAVVAVNDNITTPQGTGVIGNLLTNDENATQVTAASQGATNIPLGTPTAINGGTITINANGSFTFIPASGFDGTVPTIIYTAANANNSSSDQGDMNIQVTVALPTALNINASTISPNSIENPVPALVGISSSGSPITSYDVTPPASSQGTLYYCTTGNIPCTGSLTAITMATVLTPNQAATMVFTPAADYQGAAIFSYTASNSAGASQSATVSIPVVNQAPVANSIITGAAEQNSTENYLAMISASDVDGTIASYTISPVNSAEGTLSYCSSADIPCTGTVITINSPTALSPSQLETLNFEPANNFTGNVTFTYTATDDLGAVSQAATVLIPVTINGDLPINLPPVAQNIEASIIGNGAAQNLPSLFATDLDGSINSYTIIAIPNSTTEGTLTYCTTPPSSGCGTTVSANTTLTPAQAATLQFTPIADFTGSIALTYLATDDTSLDSPLATMNITVVNQAPVVVNIQTAIPANSTSQLLPALSANDSDGTIASYSVTAPSNTQGSLSYCSNGTEPCTGTVTPISGTVTLTPEQAATLTLTPAANYTGAVVIEFTATDNSNNESTSGSLLVNVVENASNAQTTAASNDFSLPQNAAITALSADFISASTNSGTIASFRIETIPSASQGVYSYCSNGSAPCTGTITALAAATSLTPAQAATLYFQPAANFVGIAPLTFTATNTMGLSSTPTVSIVEVTNQAPMAQSFNTTAVTLGGSPIAIDLTSHASDQNGNNTIAFYTIHSVPSALQGELTYCETPPTGCATPVTAGMILTSAQAATLTFTPGANSNQAVIPFNFSAMDNGGLESNMASAVILMSNAAALPVELIGIQVACMNNGKNAELTWQTASEFNADVFVIERSFDGYTWEAIATVEAAGTTTHQSNYSFYDNQNRAARLAYYRLSQIDIDGTKTTYPAISSDCEMSGEAKLYPNPATDVTYLEMIHTKKENVTIQVRNALGSLISSNTHNVLDGMNLISLDVKELHPGAYFVVITDEYRETKVLRFIKQ